MTVATPIFSTSRPPATLASRIAGGVVGPGGQRQAERRQHHVAGAGDVVHLPRPGREDGLGRPSRWARAMPSLSSVTIAGFQVELRRGAAAAAASASSSVAIVAAGGQARFEAVRRDRRAAAVLAVVAAADRVGEDAHAARLGRRDRRRPAAPACRRPCRSR